MNNLQIKQLNLKKGLYYHVEWKKETKINGQIYTKESQNVIHFYGDGEIVKINKNGEPYLNLKTTRNKRLKVKSKYYRNGVEITELEYYSMVEDEKNEKGIFNKKLIDIICIK